MNMKILALALCFLFLAAVFSEARRDERRPKPTKLSTRLPKNESAESHERYNGTATFLPRNHTESGERKGNKGGRRG